MAYADEVLADTPLVYLRLGETAGTSAADSSGNGRNGTFGGSRGTNFAAATGLLTGDANGATDFITAASLPLATVPAGAYQDFGAGDFSVELWYQGTTAGLVVAAANDGANAWWVGIAATSGFVRFNGGGGDITASSAAVNDGSPHHIVVTRSSGTVTIYVDGASVGSGSAAAAAGNSATVGCVGGFSGGGFACPGDYDEFALYAAALSSGRVSAHYSAGTAGDVTPPTLSGAATNGAGTAITATLSESGCVADGGGSSGTGGFTLSGTSATVASWAISGTTLTLTLSGTITGAETVTYSYARASTTDDIKDAAGNYLADFSGASVTNNAGGGDVTPPNLSSPTATVTGTTTATVGVTTDEADGTLYCVVTTSSTAPTKAQVKLGQDHAGAAAAFADDQAVGSTGAKTFNATGLAENTTYYAHFMHEDSDANQSSVSSTAAFTTRNLVAVTDANWFFSPYNWFTSGSTYRQSNCPGAYFKTKFTGTSCRLNVDVSMLSGAGVTAANYPAIAYSVDGAAPTRYQLQAGDTQLTLATGIASGTHTLEVLMVGAWWQDDRWNTPVQVVRVTGLVVDGGSALTAPDLQSGRMVLYWDSSGEGYEALAPGVSVANQDAGQSAALYIGRALACEVGNVSFAGHAFGGGAGNVPALTASWDDYHSGASRLTGGLFDPAPDWIVCCTGQNDSSGVQAAVETLITAWRAAAPSARIAFCAPPTLGNAAAISAGVAASGDADCEFVTTGEDLIGAWSTGSALRWSNANHLSVRGHALYGAVNAAEIREAFAAGGGGSGGGRQGLHAIESGAV